MLRPALVAALLAAHAAPAPPAAWTFPAPARELPTEAGREVSSLRGANPELPLHGARSASGFVLAQALDVAHAGPWVFVASSTGLWVHEADTLARRGQLRSGPMQRVAASPDGALLAFTFKTAAGVELDVLALPSLEHRAQLQLPEVAHLRFADDSTRLVIAGGGSEKVTVLDVHSGATQVRDVREQVNDAAPVPGHPELVAAAHNGDSVDLLPLDGSGARLRTEPLIRQHWEHVERHTHSFLEILTPRPSRDQRACVVDPKSGALYGAGDDNMVWRVADPLGKPQLRAVRELEGNVVALEMGANGRLFATTDDPELVALDGNGLSRGSFSAESGGGDYKDARLSADGEVLFAAIDGFLVRWSPGQRARVARSYSRDEDISILAGPVDVVLLIEDQQGHAGVQRVPPGPDNDDVEGEFLGAVPPFSADFTLAGGDRAFVGRKGGKARVVLLPSGGKLGKPIDLPFASVASAVRPDGEELAVMSRKGELVAISRAGKLERRATLKGKGEGLRWDAAKATWQRFEEE